MTRKKRLILTSAVFVALAIGATPAWACVCPELGSPSSEFGGATAVFTGTVRAVEPRGSTRSPLVQWLLDLWYGPGSVYDPYRWTDQRQIKLDVHDSWKGAVTPNVTVAISDGTCGDFLVGEEYLVYAIGGSALETSKCRRTRPVALAAEDLAFLKDMPVIFFSRSAFSRFPFVGVALGVGVVLIVIVEWVIRKRRRTLAR